MITAKHVLIVTIWEGVRPTGLVQYLYSKECGIIRNPVRFP